jgi:plasmid maintenance system antidote protein VapI
MQKRSPNVALKAAIFATGKKQQRIARLAHVTPQDLSHAIHGRRELTDAERARLAKVLGKSESDLFPSDEAVSA